MARSLLPASPRVRSLYLFIGIVAVAALALVVLGWTNSAVAADEPPAEPREAARLHYARGLELAGQADYEAALRAFSEAYRVSPHFAVLYNIGQAQVALGRPKEAIESLSKYLRDGQEQVPRTRRQEVQAQIALLETLFADLTVTTDHPGALITVDGREVGRTPLFQSIRLPAGTHKVTAAMAASADTAAVVRRTVTLASGEYQVLILEVPDAAAPAKPPEAQPAPPPPPPAPVVHVQQPEPQPGNHTRTLRIAGYSATAVGAALGGAALVVYLANRDRYQDWQREDAALQRDVGAIDHHQRQIANNQLANSLTKTNHTIVGLSLATGVALASGLALLAIDRARETEKDKTASGSTALGLGVDWGWQGPRSGAVSWSTAW